MNVGSILNGDSPPDTEVKQHEHDTTAQQVSPHASLHHRHLINDLLNDSPAGGRSSQSASSKLPETNVKTENLKVEPKFPASSKLSTEMSASLREDSIQEETPAVKEERVAGNDTKTQKNNLVEKELSTIAKLKSAKLKPRRYASPPIWAQEWIPPLQNGRDAHSAFSTPPSLAGGTGLSSKSVFDRTSTVSADLECSITGVIPPQSVVRTVAEWIYANFVEIPLDDRQYVELELKFGTIVDKVTGHRLDIGVSSECIYTQASDTRFDMGVHEVGWNDMRQFLEELEKTYQDENRKNPAKPRRKFSVLETDNTDMFFMISERNEKPKKIRITKDNAVNPPRFHGIHKKRLSDLYIHNPSSMYDLRLSLSIELPMEEQSVEPIIKKNKPILTRIKRRTSWTHAATVTQFDFTQVSQPKTTKNKYGKTVVEHDNLHELELEIDTVEIFKGFDKIRDGSDTIRFEELVEVFLNNARCLNNRVTKLALK